MEGTTRFVSVHVVVHVLVHAGSMSVPCRVHVWVAEHMTLWLMALTLRCASSVRHVPCAFKEHTHTPRQPPWVPYRGTHVWTKWLSQWDNHTFVTV